MYQPKRIATVFLILCSLFCLNPYSSKCQITKGQSEISTGIGFQSDYELITEYTAGDNNNYTHTPDYSLSYRYYLTRNFSLGLNVAYQHFVNYDNEPFENHLYGHTTNSYTFIAPEITFCYLNKIIDSKKDELRLYGLVSAGIAIYEGIFPAFQLTPIGIRFGRELAGYMEAGFGNKGLINLGLSYRFQRKN